MKKIIYLALIAFAGVTFTSCDDYTNSAEASSTTFLPKLTMNGDQSVSLACDATSYIDEGLTAEEGGAPIDVTTQVVGRYFGSSSVNGPDSYEINYIAYNKDSIPGAAIREVLWPACNGDMVTDISGMYTSNVRRNGTISAPYMNIGPIFIKDLGNGKYQLSDAIGGYYDFGRGYGYHYAALDFVVTANDIPSNDFTHEGVIGVGDFGGELVMTDFSVDAANKKITFTTDWSFGFVFEVELTQN